MNKRKISATAFLILCTVLHHQVKAQAQTGDALRKDLKKELHARITHNIFDISRHCTNSFFFLVYTVDSASHVNADLLGTDSTIQNILLQSNFETLNDKILRYARSVAHGRTMVVQPFYIGCLSSKTWIDMTDLTPLFYRLEKIYPGTKIFLEFQDIDMIH